MGAERMSERCATKIVTCSLGLFKCGIGEYVPSHDAGVDFASQKEAIKNCPPLDSSGKSRDGSPSHQKHDSLRMGDAHGSFAHRVLIVPASPDVGLRIFRVSSSVVYSSTIRTMVKVHLAETSETRSAVTKSVGHSEVYRS